MISHKIRVRTIFLAMNLFLAATASSAEPFRYDPHGKRDPFVPLIGQERAPTSVGFAEIASPDDVRLEGIAMGESGRRIAIINGDLVKEGFKSGEVEVKKINKDSVILSISGREYPIKLSEEGGKTSEQ